MVRKILAILIAGWFASLSLAAADDAIKCAGADNECEMRIRVMLAGRKYIGLKFAKTSGGIFVTSVAPGSPGERAGIRDGDRIVTINGRDCTTAKVTIVKEIMNATREGYKLSFTVARSGYFRRIDVRVESLSKDQIDKAVAAHLREAHADPAEPHR